MKLLVTALLALVSGYGYGPQQQYGGTRFLKKGGFGGYKRGGHGMTRRRGGRSHVNSSRYKAGSFGRGGLDARKRMHRFNHRNYQGQTGLKQGFRNRNMRRRGRMNAGQGARNYNKMRHNRRQNTRNNAENSNKSRRQGGGYLKDKKWNKNDNTNKESRRSSNISFSKKNNKIINQMDLDADSNEYTKFGRTARNSGGNYGKQFNYQDDNDRQIKRNDYKDYVNDNTKENAMSKKRAYRNDFDTQDANKRKFNYLNRNLRNANASYLGGNSKVKGHLMAGRYKNGSNAQAAKRYMSGAAGGGYYGQRINGAYTNAGGRHYGGGHGWY
jgi:hypothetical protein